jgi:hypothetical protein
VLVVYRIVCIVSKVGASAVHSACVGKPHIKAVL